MYDLVVGADGLRSTVRRSTPTTSEPVEAGQLAWRSIAPLRPAGLDGVEFWLGTDRFFGLCPVGEHVTYGFGNVDARAGRREPVAGRRRRLAGHFAEFGAPVREFIDGVVSDGDVHVSPIEWLPETVWSHGRLVLIGDAVHAMSPMMGQGGCMAIEDAVVLADDLNRAPDLSSAVCRFAARRGERVEGVRRQSQALGQLVRLPPPVRDRALREQGVTAFRDRYRPLITPP